MPSTTPPFEPDCPGDSQCVNGPPAEKAPPDVSMWTPDRCATMFMAAIILKPHHIWHLTGFAGDDGETRMETGGYALYVGDQYPISIHAVRAVEYTNPKSVAYDDMKGEYIGSFQNPDQGEPVEFGEACRFHLGRVALGIEKQNGESVVWTCSEPTQESDLYRESSFAVSMIMEGPRRSDLPMNNHEEYHRTSYETPKWYEAAFHSTPCRCEEVI